MKNPNEDRDFNQTISNFTKPHEGLKTIFSLKKLKNSICFGETYCVIAATQIDQESVKVESFVIFQNHGERLHCNIKDHYKKNAPDDYELVRYLEIAQISADTLIERLLGDRAVEMEDPEIESAHKYNLSWTPTLEIPAEFRNQIRDIIPETYSPALRDHLCDLVRHR